MSLWRYANPAEFMRVSGRALPVLWALTAASLAIGLGSLDRVKRTEATL